MKLSELIAKVGDDNVKFQNLRESLKRVDKRKDHTEIVFGTKAVTAEEFFLEPKFVAFVVWLPKDKVDAALKD